jgi:hypothetical protein
MKGVIVIEWLRFQPQGCGCHEVMSMAAGIDT